MNIEDRMHIYGYEPVIQTRTIKLTRRQRLKRAIEKRSIKEYFIKDIKESLITSVSLSHIQA